MSLGRLVVAFLVCSTLMAADNTLRVIPDHRSLVKAEGSVFFLDGRYGVGTIPSPES